MNSKKEPRGGVMKDEERWAARDSMAGISSHHLYAIATPHAPRRIHPAPQPSVPPTLAMFRSP